jgi:hypothetical protein
MLKPDPHSDEQPGDGGVPRGDPSFEKLMQLVFSRPIYLEPLEEPESEKDENEETESEPKAESQPQ